MLRSESGLLCRLLAHRSARLNVEATEILNRQDYGVLDQRMMDAQAKADEAVFLNRTINLILEIQTGKIPLQDVTLTIDPPYGQTTQSQ